MQDIVPDLLDAIQKNYKQRLNSSATVKRIQSMIEAGTATYAEANEYAIEVGNLLAEVFRAYISGDVLPDGRMYYNIAQRILQPTMSENYELVATAAQQVQTSLNHASGLGLRGLKADLNQDRIDGIINRLASEESYDKVAWLLDDPVVTASQSIVDDTVRKNAQFQSDAGLSPKIVRKAEPNCCKWCSNLDGEYDYGEVRSGSDVFRRHANCRCTVEFEPGSGKRINVHTKQGVNSDENANIEDRINRINRLNENKFSNATPAQFSKAVKDARDYVDVQDRWRVTAYDADHYVGSKLHVSSGGSTTAVDKTGDIISVCRRHDDSVRGSDLIQSSVKNGGIKLDSFAGNHGFYLKNGFEPVSWCELVDEYAPDDWQPWMDKEPIIFYRYTGATPSTIEDVSEFLSRVHASPDYDVAQATRDALLGG